MTMQAKKPIRDRITDFVQGPTSTGILGVLGYSLAPDAAQTVAAANAPHDPAMQRMSGQAVAGINTASGQGGPMADNLQAGYLHLNLPGSPLGSMAMLSANSTRRAQVVQDAIQANEQRMMTGMMIPRGTVPMTQADQMAQQTMMQRRR